MEDDTVLIININLRQRSGYFSASSPDLPGLHVCGETEDRIRESVVLGIKTLFKRNRGLDVSVRPIADSISSFPKNGKSFGRLAVLHC